MVQKYSSSIEPGTFLVLRSEYRTGISVNQRWTFMWTGPMLRSNLFRLIRARRQRREGRTDVLKSIMGA